MRLTIVVCLCVPLAILGCGQGSTAASTPPDPNLPIISQTISGKDIKAKRPR